MKLLFDENLSRKLARSLSELYPGSKHLADVALIGSDDREIWDYAGPNGFVLTTTDADFFDLASSLGPPPKVIWLRRWSHPTWDAEELLRREAVRITASAADLDLGILILENSIGICLSD